RLRIDVHLAEGLDHTLELGHEDLPSHGLPIFVRSTDPHYSFAGNRTGLDDEFVILPRYNCCQWLARRIIAFSGTASESFCNPESAPLGPLPGIVAAIPPRDL